MTAPPTDPPRQLDVDTHVDADHLLYTRYPDLHAAIDHAHGTDDPVCAPSHPEPRAKRRDNSMTMWLPDGYHWDLHIEHRPLESAGAMTIPDMHKGILHTTESPWFSVDAMFDVLQAKRAAPQFILGGRTSLDNPVLIQTMPIDIAGRALEHPAGTPETNRAACVQIEICWYASKGADLADWQMKALANVFTLVDHRYNISTRLFGDFANPARLSDAQWAHAYGYGGHSHVPRNTHWDPGAFRGSRFATLLGDVPVSGYSLSH